MTALYNEIEPFAVEWLRSLVANGHIAQGVIDGRSIKELTPEDLRPHAQAHFFAGIGVWSHALRLAGWPDDVPVWTGSCPCQPFSQAGRGRGEADERHLWPDWFKLIDECRPPIIFGEQVASPDALKWLDAVSADLEGAGYAVGAADLCAAGVGAPHIRQRLYWVAIARDERREGLRLRLQSGQPRPAGSQADGSGAAGGVADALPTGRPERGTGAGGGQAAGGRGAGIVADDDDEGLEGWQERRDGADERAPRPGGLAGFWSPAEWLPCRDGKQRPVEPGTFPLVDGAPGRVGRLRAYGNAIVAPLAAEFIRSVMEAIHGRN